MKDDKQNDKLKELEQNDLIGKIIQGKELDIMKEMKKGSIK